MDWWGERLLELHPFIGRDSPDIKIPKRKKTVTESNRIRALSKSTGQRSFMELRLGSLRNSGTRLLQQDDLHHESIEEARRHNPAVANNINGIKKRLEELQEWFRENNKSSFLEGSSDGSFSSWTFEEHDDVFRATLKSPIENSFELVTHNLEKIVRLRFGPFFIEECKFDRVYS